jgi:heme-degrading monooxygenase HmoA
MILESAILTVRSEQDAAFASALAEARPLIAASPGFQGIEVRPCVEQPRRYLLLVWWDRLTDHTEGFRGSERYQEWKALLHHFYDPFPEVEHFGPSIL